jgi:hypothetical protein
MVWDMGSAQSTDVIVKNFVIRVAVVGGCFVVSTFLQVKNVDGNYQLDLPADCKYMQARFRGDVASGHGWHVTHFFQPGAVSPTR